MYLFILGFILGLGVIPALQEIHCQRIERRNRKAAAFNAAVAAEADRRELDAWGITRSPHTTGVDLTGWGTIPESADRPRSTTDTDWSK